MPFLGSKTALIFLGTVVTFTGKLDGQQVKGMGYPILAQPIKFAV
jgi:hypothetical protein